MLWYVLNGANGSSRSESIAISFLDADCIIFLIFCIASGNSLYGKSVSCSCITTKSASSAAIRTRILSASLAHQVVHQTSMAPCLNSSALSYGRILTAMNLRCVTYHSMESGHLRYIYRLLQFHRYLNLKCSSCWHT